MAISRRAILGTPLSAATGSLLYLTYLFQVKAPSESHGPWGYYKIIGTTPTAES